MNHIFESLYVFAAGLIVIFQEKAVILALFAAFIVVLIVFQMLTRRKFKNKQLEYPRVKDALNEKYTIIRDAFEDNGINYPPRQVFIRIFKEEAILELWASSLKKGPFIFVKDYDISSTPLSPGPKRRQGDDRIPEGFYYIDRFSPWSKHYLSLGLNYPNESDRILGSKESLVEDIYIHGGVNAPGCIPITDDKIKELYIVAVEAVAGGQDRIPVHIFPRRLSKEGYNGLKKRYEDDYSLISFWNNIMQGFEAFEHTRMLSKITVDTEGKYIFKRK